MPSAPQAPPYVPDGLSTSAPPAAPPPPATAYAPPDPAGRAVLGRAGGPAGTVRPAGRLDPQYQSGAAQSAGYPGSAAPPAWAAGLAGGSWSAVVSADRSYYDMSGAARLGAEGIDFPVYAAERRFRLAGAQMRIGRRSVSRGLEPEIDLTGPPVDPGISRLHAVLIAALDGGWAVLDPGSANGTLVNGAEVRVGDQVPLHDGDRINLGAWTAITVQYA